MTSRARYISDVGNAEQLCEIWSTHMDALERHLSVHTWALGAATVVLLSYPVARIAVPAIVHGIVPDVVRSVLHFI